MNVSRTAVAIVTGFAALTLAACGPAGVQDTGSAAPTTRTVTTYVSPSATTASASPSATGSISPSPSAPASTSPAGVPVTTSAKATTRRTTAPSVHRTTAPAVHRTTAPAVHHTSAPAVHHTSAPAAGGACSIRSNAGNCYKAGQFCRKADLGRTTTDAQGRSITCRMKSGKPHWQY
ncbi:hypothetical protein [Streptomyces sp. NBC_01477]|uniref:hypothetical protein n=1 Tax=Streptomyces sp. NBC_01477 TaxID=2976015 RepID=UPI002E32DDCA|nr:hypothetical protein [Streptomyces sp. NBC_01477]